MKKQTSIVMLFVVIGVVLLSGCMSQNDTEKKDISDLTKEEMDLAYGRTAEGRNQKILDKTDIDPASGGVAGVGIVTGDEALEDTSGEIGYIGKTYSVDNIPATIVFSYSEGKRKDLDNFKILNLRCENGEIKFCVKDSERTRPYEGGLTLQVSANNYVIQHFQIDEPKTECYEVSPNLEAIGDVQSILIRISNIS